MSEFTKSRPCVEVIDNTKPPFSDVIDTHVWLDIIYVFVTILIGGKKKPHTLHKYE